MLSCGIPLMVCSKTAKFARGNMQGKSMKNEKIYTKIELGQLRPLLPNQQQNKQTNEKKMHSLELDGVKHNDDITTRK